MARANFDDELETVEEAEELEPFVTYDIASYPSDLTLAGICDMWTRGDISIPEFQRNFVWNVKQASLLIESFLLGLPVPQVFFYLDEDNKSLVIDGQQRIMSVVYFFEGYFGDETTQHRRQVFRLVGLDERSPFANKRYEDLDEVAQRKLRHSVLRAINIRQLTPKNENTSVYHIFERLNTGGTPLKPQEIRNCVFRGGFVNVLKKLNADENWRKILGKPKFDPHQKDMEILLRIFALSAGDWQNYEKPMKEFLNKAMNENKSGATKRVKAFSKAFIEATKLIVESLDDKPFHLRGPLNVSAMDAVMATLIDNINRPPKNFAARFEKLLGDDKFLSAAMYDTSDVAVLQTRFQVTKKILIG